MTWLESIRAHPAWRERDWFWPLWLSSSAFRRCWRAFGRTARSHPYLRSDVRVRSFHPVSREQLLRSTNSLQASPLHDDVRDLPSDATLYAIEFTSKPDPGDEPRFPRRVLVAYGDPSSSRPSLHVEGMDIACWL